MCRCETRREADAIRNTHTLTTRSCYTCILPFHLCRSAHIQYVASCTTTYLYLLIDRPGSTILLGMAAYVIVIVNMCRANATNVSSPTTTTMVEMAQVFTANCSETLVADVIEARNGICERGGGRVTRSQWYFVVHKRYRQKRRRRSMIFDDKIINIRLEINSFRFESFFSRRY